MQLLFRCYKRVIAKARTDVLELPMLRLFYPTSSYKFDDVQDGNVIFFIDILINYLNAG